MFRNGKLLKKWDFSELISASEAPVPQEWYSEYLAPMLLKVVAEAAS